MGTGVDFAFEVERKSPRFLSKADESVARRAAFWLNGLEVKLARGSSKTVERPFGVNQRSLDVRR